MSNLGEPVYDVGADGFVLACEASTNFNYADYGRKSKESIRMAMIAEMQHVLTALKITTFLDYSGYDAGWFDDENVGEYINHTLHQASHVNDDNGGEGEYGDDNYDQYDD